MGVCFTDDRRNGSLALELAQPGLLINSPDLQDGRRFFNVQSISDFKVLTLSQVTCHLPLH